MTTDNENEKPDFFEAKHQETLKRIIELLRNKDYSKAWYKVLYDLTDGYDIPLTDEIVMTEEQADEYYAEGRICLAYVNDAFEDEILNPLCIVEAPWFGKPGNKSFLRNVVSSIAEDIDDDGYLEAWDFFHGCKYWNWTRHARYFIPAVEPLDENIIDFYTEDGKVNLDVFCPHYGIDKNDVVSVENEKVYIRPESLKKLKRGIDDTRKTVGNDERSNEEKKAENDEVHAYLSEHGYTGGILWKDENCDGFILETDANANDIPEYISASLKVLSDMARDKVDMEEWMLRLAHLFIEIYKEGWPEEAERNEREWDLFKAINRNAEA